MIERNEKVDELLRALAQSDHMDYFGEPVSQLQHGLQAAQFARDAGADDEMIAAALLHDIGHIISGPDAHRDDEVGVIDHDRQGADYLLGLGFSERVATLVQGHVAAKRYLVATNPSYANALSAASTRTLELQGGPMSQEEAEQFREHPSFREMIQLRGWDERAKEVDCQVAPLSEYRDLLMRIL
jgi:2-amino-1-hydroxyethylphosphonate dioxygenase (glycine-forming)